MRLTVGDLVELKSGSLPMLVVDVDPLTDQVTVAWKGKLGVQEHTLRAASVERRKACKNRLRA